MASKAVEVACNSLSSRHCRAPKFQTRSIVGQPEVAMFVPRRAPGSAQGVVRKTQAVVPLKN